MENQTTKREKDLVIIGAQGSGKTTLANKHASAHHRSRVIEIDEVQNSVETWQSLRGRLVGRGGAELVIIEGIRAWVQVLYIADELNTFFEEYPELRPRLIFTSLEEDGITEFFNMSVTREKFEVVEL